MFVLKHSNSKKKKQQMIINFLSIEVSFVILSITFIPILINFLLLYHHHKIEGYSFQTIRIFASLIGGGKKKIINNYFPKYLN